METRVVKVPGRKPLGRFREISGPSRLQHWDIDTGVDEEAIKHLKEAAEYLKTSDTPVAFPTETVYGLAADATRSASTKGIYTAKGRPSDNPLIIHVCDLEMLRGLLVSDPAREPGEDADPIPSRYKPLIERFWPGPLTLLMPNPKPSRLAPEVTAGLPSFGARMPSTSLALSLIKLSGVPLAAPSANASTKPSPTTAQHVKHDLDGKIELILDGGPCPVGVESTVVDGLCDPPAVLRPGGVGIDELRSCPGWENVVKAYKDHGHDGKDAAPRAPGMKYKHYSPRARVVLYEATCKEGSGGITPSDAELARIIGKGENSSTNGSVAANGKHLRRIGVIRTQRWGPAAGLPNDNLHLAAGEQNGNNDPQQPGTSYDVLEGNLVDDTRGVIGTILDIDLGRDTRGIAQGLFSALRELDRRGADVIFVDGIDDEIDIAGAVMNRLRKAASEIRT
ncbi:Threonylcarbamoyl-AMP synthase-like protein [Hapsidospora chrysogenum ATCC 11550]|uniref:Threonylcarbamoyl-AMP synthase n=1 Tax=Hapsidospora chrysogenum (strain ATCC 11550 / CBS 779.69 / DSM 880 / IAM 14645 / JCM 23072 / IMI 49137) TaxID=857340 RepID=A0A086T0U4_HAPC1|nr:Threonylcarbamoyl-AMP synthase-like protein [Hapsidospora chrysogenum ATCC 11550]